jgi:hypothetical protein
MPQHFAAPLLVAAQVWLRAAATETTPEAKPDTGVGVVCIELMTPLPNCELSFLPQHNNAPALVIAHVWNSPAAMATTPELNPDTATGTELLVVELSPSCP